MDLYQSSLFLPIPIVCEIILFCDKWDHLSFRLTCKLFKSFLDEKVIQCMVCKTWKFPYPFMMKNVYSPIDGVHDKKRKCIYFVERGNVEIKSLDIARREARTIARFDSIIMGLMMDHKEDCLYFSTVTGHLCRFVGISKSRN